MTEEALQPEVARQLTNWMEAVGRKAVERIYSARFAEGKLKRTFVFGPATIVAYLLVAFYKLLRSKHIVWVTKHKYECHLVQVFFHFDRKPLPPMADM